MHAGPAIEFLQKDIHVICDKPMTATMDDAHELMSAIKSSKAHFFLTHNYSGYPVIREMRSLSIPEPAKSSNAFSVTSIICF